ncbi:hypothetical protein B296_00014432 [Ensete ventricosum]|uniref:CTCHY-type domain-containing protein n=1 Tax=Ensete ventricosum TaxID=4639 RepID=A0A427AKQ4_ENSVE|nr:hypothetical protein B296_00014432 [Ensete ventricosum]
MTCNCCLGMKLKEHKCREKGIHLQSLHLPNLQQILGRHGCKLSNACYTLAFVLIGNGCAFVQVYFGMIDALLAAEQLPEEYRDRCQVTNNYRDTLHDTELTAIS